jgi:hypothetical protein
MEAKARIHAAELGLKFELACTRRFTCLLKSWGVSAA